MEKFLTNKKFIIIAIITLITGTVFYKIENTNYDNFIEENIFEEQNYNNEEKIVKESKIKVHIIGEINSPGLYELDEDSRINDLILIAGGQTENANLNKVNLAYELSDGEQIYIPSIFDEETEYNNKESSSSSGKININKASLEDFQTISGIGPSLAQKIITYRNSIGKFSSIEELKNVSGIGDKKYESIKDFVSLK